MKPLTLLIAAALFGVLPADAQQAAQGPYRLLEGSGEDPCESLLANVQAAASAPPIYDWCEPPVDLRDPRFTSPQWKEMDYKANLDIIETMFLRGEYLNAWSSLYQARYPGRDDKYEIVRKKYWPGLKAKVLAGFEDGRAHLQFADFDIDNDGKTDRVTRMTSWQVIPPTAVDKKLPASMRDVRFSEPCYPGSTKYRYWRLEERPTIYASGGVGQYLQFAGYLFQFNGKTYFGISPYRLSLTKRGVGNGPTFYLSGDQPEKQNMCFITR